MDVETVVAKCGLELQWHHRITHLLVVISPQDHHIQCLLVTYKPVSLTHNTLSCPKERDLVHLYHDVALQQAAFRHLKSLLASPP